MRAEIEAIAADALAAFDEHKLWVTLPLDEPEAADTRYSMLYLGAGGVICGLQRLARLGFTDVPASFGRVIPTLVARNREVGETQHGPASFLMGDAGLLLLEWQQSPSRDIEARLLDCIRSNLRHPARESLWGSPGTLLAALHVIDATGSEAFKAVVREGVSILLDEMEFDEALQAWSWRQDMYGRQRIFVGAGHGFAGNVYPVLRAAPFLDAAVLQQAIERSAAFLGALALEEDGCANWHAVHDPAAVAGRLPLTQDCHGAPGIVVRLAGMPREEPWDRLLEGAGELTWRAGPLVKGPSLCHGTAGNGYALLKMWTRTGDDVWLARARAFGMHAMAQVQAARQRQGHGRHSLWTGDIGVALFLAACISGDSAFPTLDTF